MINLSSNTYLFFDINRIVNFFKFDIRREKLDQE